MAIRAVLRLGDPRLLVRSSEVEQFGTRDLETLLTDMLDTMEALDGAGLAAPQIGVPLRVIIFGVAFATLAGVYSLTVLPSGIYPEAQFPRIAVIARSGDLSPQMMTVAVTRPLEEAARGAGTGTLFLQRFTCHSHEERLLRS